MEQKLADICIAVLQIPAISVHDNMFSLGADSLTLFRIAARMIDQGIGLEAKHVMRHPTVAELAELAERMASGEEAASTRPSLRDFRGGARRQRT
jgi:aryl carrier-like protein